MFEKNIKKRALIVHFLVKNIKIKKIMLPLQKICRHYTFKKDLF